MKRIVLLPKEEDRLLAGHPWIYDNEIARVEDAAGPAELEAGEVVDVTSSRRTYLGRAFANPNSKIRARIFSPSKDGVDRGFFKRRIREAALYRRRSYDFARDSCRLVFAEADFLPGLIVDRFVGWPLAEAKAVWPDAVPGFDAVAGRLGPARSWLAVQLLAYGVDARRDDVVAALAETLGAPLGPGLAAPGAPEGIVERDEAAVRELEGLPVRSGLLTGTCPEAGVLIFENGLPFAVDLLGGQKTGHFLDQAANRAAAAAYVVPGARVLDACCHTGGFGIAAARAGAREVVALDASSHALTAAAANAVLAGVADRFRTAAANVFDYLRAAARAGERFDLVVLDPPAFAKSRSMLEGALRGYKDINLRALELLAPGGILVTCSCSHALDEERFKATVAEAARDAGKRLRLLGARYQAPDHPILVGYAESLYLKALFYEVV
jgi:23S rRNA (cytosine1962-C5)-methyltransferase